MAGFADDLATAGTITGLLATVGGFYVALRSTWTRTLGARRKLVRGIDGLAAGLPGEELERLLGPCSLRVKHEAPDVLQQIYLSKHACVDVLLDRDTSTVIGFSITARTKRLRFRTDKLSFGMLDVTLGQSRFDALPSGEQSSVHWWNGARDSGYAEHYYVGNPGGYQDYILAHVKTGSGPLAYSDVPAPHDGGFASGQFVAEGTPGFEDLYAASEAGESDDWSTFRSKTVVNTFQVLGAGWTPRQLPRPGVNGDVTRTLHSQP